MEHIIGLKQLRQSAGAYIERVRRGQRFVVLRRSRPVFKIVPVDASDTGWEDVVDLTKVKHGGVHIDDVLARL